LAKEETNRLTAHEIFDGVVENGRKELDRKSKALAFSGLAGGMTMGLTGMSVAIAAAYLGHGQVQQLIANLLYPLGFIAVIIGRAQLFTENTLYPVVLILKEKRHVLDTARLWVVVFVTNVIGALAFAALVTKTGALRPEYVDALSTMGVEAARPQVATIFWSGVIGGWLIALVAWMVTASHYTIGQIAVVWLLAYVVGAGHFAHCIATSGEIWAAVLTHAISASAYLRWIIPATLGNIVGGVTIVSLLNYGQVVAGES
jgi:formate-nitrite transporter family protein